MNLTKQQLAAFWRIFPQAAKEMGGDETSYRRKVLSEEAGVEHLGDLGRTTGFEKVMSRLASDAGDFELAIKYAGGESNRYRHLILTRARDIISKSGDTSTTPERYVAGILLRGRMVYRPYLNVDTLGDRMASGEEWDSFPPATLHLLLQIITTEWRKVRAGK